MLLLDYGHGGILNGKYQTSGKQYHFTSGLSVYEGVINRQVAIELARLAMQDGHEVIDVLTGKQFNINQVENRDIPLATRVSNANKYKGVYISLHADAAGNTSTGSGHNATGGTIYTSIGDTGADKIADSIAKSMAQVVHVRRDLKDNDWDMEADFYVLKKTHMPAVLIEMGFFTNEEEARRLLDTVHQQALALAIYDALRACL